MSISKHVPVLLYIQKIVFFYRPQTYFHIPSRTKEIFEKKILETVFSCGLFEVQRLDRLMTGIAENNFETLYLFWKV